MMKKIVLFILLVLYSPFIFSQDEDIPTLSWPRDVIKGEDTVTVYQPQLESFENNIIEGRMAISMNTKSDGLVFGAVMFKATVNTDLDERLVELEKMDIIQTNFPDVEEEKAAKFVRELELAIEGSTELMSLDRILASMELIEKENDLSTQFKNDPPEIYYRDAPAVLILIDGDPILKDTDDANIQYVINTPYFIVKDTKKNQHYIKGGDYWYTSKEISGDWQNTENVPNSIEKMADEVIEMDSVMSDSLIATMEAPNIIVVTRPSELILVDGVPDYKTIEGTTLLYVDNTESDIVMDINSQQHFVLLSGRWYASKTLQDGDWKFTEPNNLPNDFSKIPAESDIGNVRTSVPGTEEANAAVLEQTIPQTATVDRTTTVEVSFDGNPEFKKIDGSEVSYAENSDKTVLLVKNKYYCVDDGIWFESDQATGPYVVSVNRPAEVDDIPPESPVYNVKYVYIYDSTPEVVYVGYTPGYTCSYVYGGVVVYGTGWYYHPWYRTVYYPRPATWGFRVHYNPWTGWGFSFGMSWGWFGVGFHRGPGWWGPRGYRYGYRHGFHRGYRHGYRHGYHHGMRAGYRAGYRAGRASASGNVYRNRASGVRSTGMNRTNQANMARNRAGGANQGNLSNNRATTGNRAAAGNRATTGNQAAAGNRAGSGTRTQPSTKQNNVYAGRDGNVYRRDNSGNVQQRNNGQWSGGGSSGSSNRSGSQQSVNRQYQSRQQGNQQYNNYNNSRSRSGTSYGGRSGASRSTGSRGGGGARRR
jgi:hypothetical protein